jgi:hypothetical protein
LPDDPDDVVGPRPAAKTGVDHTTISRWTRECQWQRHPFAPRSTDTSPSARAGARLRARTLAARLAALAERYVRELEETPGVDLDNLAEALELMKMAKAAARPRRRKNLLAESMRPIIELCAADVRLRAAPRAAVEDFLESRTPTSAEPTRRRRRWRSKRNEHHAWMLEKESDR